MNRKIVKAVISDLPKSFGDPIPEAIVTFDDGSQKTLFSFYPDEISFTASEFIGLSEAEALDLKRKKDVAFIKS